MLCQNCIFNQLVFVDFFDGNSMVINKMGYTAWTSNDVHNITGQAPTSLETYINENKHLFAPHIPDQIKVGIIGGGNVGGSIAKALAKTGHQVKLGCRDVNSAKVKATLSKVENVSADTIKNTVEFAQVMSLS